MTLIDLLGILAFIIIASIALTRLFGNGDDSDI
jgi:hypothetical protein